jgi:phosphoglycerol transferase MdoB-like AlkP superfamily enzyme
MKKQQSILKHYNFIFFIYLTGILFFTAFRLILLILEAGQLNILPGAAWLIFQSFVIGFRFDTVISCYILTLPLLALAAASFFRFENKIFYRAVTIFISVFYLIAFFICAADIPYFKYYFSRITIAILNWVDSPAFMFKMVFEEIKYLIFLFVFILVGAFFVFIVVKIYRKRLLGRRFGSNIKNSKFLYMNIAAALLSVCLVFVGIRGRIEQKSPIRVGTAFFSNYAFPNQLALNPVFTFIRSWLDAQKPENKNLKLLDDKAAIENVKRYLGVNGGGFQSPIARKVTAGGNEIKANIVVVIMESMSAAKMARFGNPGNLTPNLDSLSKIAYCFDNIYSAGIHTRNGIYSTLFSYPALLRQHPMDKVIVPRFSGFSNTLSDAGYHTIFFTTHDDQFDNIGGFLNSNSFHRVISKKDYPTDKILSTLGVSDDYLFEFSIPMLNELNSDGKPFFAAFMTASDHGPYIIPKGIPFKPHSEDIQKQIVEYADWSIGKFLKLASKQKWYSNTIFVFVADHGAILGDNVYDMPLTFNHTPLIIYSPSYTSPKVFKQLGGQIDIFPTVMGLLNVSYVNNTMGVNLLRESRPYIYFSNDEKIGCLDQEYFYIYRTENGTESLYKYRNNETENYLNILRQKADSMKNYSFSMMQASQWLIQNGKTGYIK